MSHPTITEIASCLSDYDPQAMPVEQAKAIIERYVTPIDAIEQAELHHVLGRVLATDILSPIDVPPHDNAAMDGYALRGADLQTDSSVTLTVMGQALAGKKFKGTVDAGECVHIMTGAVIPDGCDTVIPQENVQEAQTTHIVVPPSAVATGDNCRSRGEDLRAGTPALTRGILLRPAELGLLASLGINRVPVYRKLRVAIFSTGDELRSPGEPLDSGSIYDSNRHTLYGMLIRLGCDVIDMGIIRDDPALLETAFAQAAEKADVVITSAGVSVGAADFTKQVMASLGDISFWKIAMRPGRPLALGKIRSGEKSAVLFGLPGNPVAAMITFYFIVRDALLHMMGAAPRPIPTIRAKAQSPIAKRIGRTEYQRGVLSHTSDGELQVRLTGSQGSGILRSMSEANCIIVLPQHAASVAPGDKVSVVLLDGLI